jgi:hypothetical protein
MYISGNKISEIKYKNVFIYWKEYLNLSNEGRVSIWRTFCSISVNEVSSIGNYASLKNLWIVSWTISTNNNPLSHTLTKKEGEWEGQRKEKRARKDGRERVKDVKQNTLKLYDLMLKICYVY